MPVLLYLVVFFLFFLQNADSFAIFALLLPLREESGKPSPFRPFAFHESNAGIKQPKSFFIALWIVSGLNLWILFVLPKFQTASALSRLAEFGSANFPQTSYMHYCPLFMSSISPNASCSATAFIHVHFCHSRLHAEINKLLNLTLMEEKKNPQKKHPRGFLWFQLCKKYLHDCGWLLLFAVHRGAPRGSHTTFAPGVASVSRSKIITQCFLICFLEFPWTACFIGSLS